MKLSTILIIGFGGFMGTIFRYLTSVYFLKNYPSSFIPYGTFAVNFLGCLAIGMMHGIFERFHILSPQWRLFLLTGICGGYTTFSTFAYENILMLQQAKYISFAVYSIGTLLLCLLAIAVGLALAKAV